MLVPPDNPKICKSKKYHTERVFFVALRLDNLFFSFAIQETMEFGQASGENINDFYQDAATSTEVSTFHRIQKTIGETILIRFVSINEDDSSSCLIRF